MLQRGRVVVAGRERIGRPEHRRLGLVEQLRLIDAAGLQPLGQLAGELGQLALELDQRIDAGQVRLAAALELPRPELDRAVQGVALAGDQLLQRLELRALLAHAHASPSPSPAGGTSAGTGGCR